MKSCGQHAARIPENQYFQSGTKKLVIEFSRKIAVLPLLVVMGVRLQFASNSKFTSNLKSLVVK